MRNLNIQKYIQIIIYKNISNKNKIFQIKLYLEDE